MSLSIDRRQAIQGATAATIGVSALPLAANAKIRNDFRAPLVEIFDARGCDVKKQQYIVRSLLSLFALAAVSSPSYPGFLR